MKKKLILAAAVLGFLPTLAMGQNTVRPVKNIILMISDGTSLSSVSLARWMQFYRNPVPLRHRAHQFLQCPHRRLRSDHVVLHVGPA